MNKYEIWKGDVMTCIVLADSPAAAIAKATEWYGYTDADPQTVAVLITA